MMNKFNFIFLIIIFSSAFSFAEDKDFLFRIALKDKGNPPYTIEHPEAYLSEKSILRRQKQGIAIDSMDLPIDPVYLAQIESTGATIRAKSKWVKTVTVLLNDSSRISDIKALGFVDSVCCVWKGVLPQPDMLKSNKTSKLEEEYSAVNITEKSLNIYGNGYTQINMLKGDFLHDLGFKGKGMSIAVIDGGFRNSDQISAFDPNRIKEVKSFSHRTENPYRVNESHGTSVLSCMLANEPGSLVGTAPEADYYLFVSEVPGEEFPVEEDYWIATIEYADSIGIDVTNTSLGYTNFYNYPQLNHTHEQLDGKSTLISQAAQMAGRKGILVFNSAGNERLKSWVNISFPADAENIITVGAVDANSVISFFSSIGPTADGRIKPDMLAMGTQTALFSENGELKTGNGTSFSSPVLAGCGACLWQALPEKTNLEIVEIMRKSSDRHLSPDNTYGYGIPDMRKAFSDNSSTKISDLQINKEIFFDPSSNRLYLNFENKSKNLNIQIYNGLGQFISGYNNPLNPLDLNFLSSGMYIARIYSGQKLIVQKFIKL